MPQIVAATRKAIKRTNGLVLKELFQRRFGLRTLLALRLAGYIQDDGFIASALRLFARGRRVQCSQRPSDIFSLLVGVGTGRGRITPQDQHFWTGHGDLLRRREADIQLSDGTMATIRAKSSYLSQTH